ncbi:hypothetical protein L0B70_12490 [Kaistella sp. 97-N-M2]|uniref:hypothetical protein n=1 Tax=Kaistella sp. 97-N-M2 TaxID=2908645 RepID=UPI001F231B32|nr:hypothetical protein [Kaistella sp. 97-N-M2]UJF29639.1 hypothetical protein L0B70_12490 [Kaistella sp. 97-N-M2]
MPIRTFGLAFFLSSQKINEAGANFKMFGPDGTEVKPADMLRKRELDAKEERIKNNNPLELDMMT